MNTDPFSKENLITIFALSKPRVWAGAILLESSIYCWGQIRQAAGSISQTQRINLHSY